MASHSPRAHQPPRPIRWWTFALALAAIAGVYMISYLWFSAPIPDTPPPDDATSPQSATERLTADLELVRLQSEARRNALYPTGAVAGAFGLWLALHRQRHNEYEQFSREQEQQRAYEQRERADAAAREDALQRRITDSRIRAVEQLGSNSSTIRIGGLHNLERLGEQHPEQRQVIIDQLCSYLRQPYQLPQQPSPPHLDRAQFEPIGPAPATSPVDEGEKEVRFLAQEILERHLRTEAGDEHWRHRRLNLRGAHLDGLDLAGARITEANFADATFTGALKLAKAQFKGNANFGGAIFTGPVDMEKVAFGAAANFHGATFNGQVNAIESRFDSKTDFEGAEFKELARFDRARFTDDADFDEITVRKRASFEKTNFGGKASFRKARFADRVTFELAVFNDSAGFWDADCSAHVSFRGTVFMHYAEFSRVAFATAKFEGAQFCGSAEFGNVVFDGLVEFNTASFGGTATFRNTQFKGAVTFANAHFPIGVIFNDAEFHRLPAFDRARFGGLIGREGVKLPRHAPEFLNLLAGTADFDTNTRHLGSRDPTKDQYRLSRHPERS